MINVGLNCLLLCIQCNAVYIFGNRIIVSNIRVYRFKEKAKGKQRSIYITLFIKDCQYAA